MTKIYKYIFSRAYYFCINVFREKEFPYFFASGVVSMLFVGSIVVALELLKYAMLPIEINIYGKYHGYFSLTMLAVISILLSRNNYYLKILKFYHGRSAKENRSLALWSSVYIIIVLFGFFFIGYLLRDYYMNKN
jgi:hypothetical protein